jgi:hypothetical protein
VVDSVNGLVSREEVLVSVDGELARGLGEPLDPGPGYWDPDTWGTTPEAQETQMRMIEMLGGLVE